MRNLEFLKPAKFSEHVTISELSRIVGREISWLRQLEREGRIPKASRVQRGKLSVRLWSPEQVEEIEDILSEMRVGRPPNP
jgi:DNA-binding transcriptional MerR regulator